MGSVALLLQALFFAHGGLTSWGANVIAMAAAGSFAGFGSFFLARNLGLGLGTSAGIAGFAGDLATYGVTSLQLALALHGQEAVPLHRRRSSVRLPAAGGHPEGSGVAVMKKWIIAMAVIAVFLAGVLATTSDWDGDITEAAADPLAEAAGVEESGVLPWSIEGDLLLFLFLSGGAAAGFAGGYYWRKVFIEQRETDDDPDREEAAV
jgi:cobalt/nickel transport system permease protein